MNNNLDRLEKTRLVWVSRRFWPLIGGAERMIGYLAAAWVETGGRSTVLTARWDPTWPTEIRFEQMPVEVALGGI